MNSLFETGGDSAATTHDWLTPPEIVQALGPFDLDPCASQRQPWRTASKQYTIDDNGLNQVWEGRVWCNPPYGKHAEQWLDRMARHDNGILLIFARTDTVAFQKYVFGFADALLFVAGRISFCLPDGSRTIASRSGAPSVLCAYGEKNVEALEIALGGRAILGTMVSLRAPSAI